MTITISLTYVKDDGRELRGVAIVGNNKLVTAGIPRQYIADLTAQLAYAFDNNASMFTWPLWIGRIESDKRFTYIPE